MSPCRIAFGDKRVTRLVIRRSGSRRASVASAGVPLPADLLTHSECLEPNNRRLVWGIRTMAAQEVTSRFGSPGPAPPEILRKNLRGEPECGQGLGGTVRIRGGRRLGRAVRQDERGSNFGSPGSGKGSIEEPKRLDPSITGFHLAILRKPTAR